MVAIKKKRSLAQYKPLVSLSCVACVAARHVFSYGPPLIFCALSLVVVAFVCGKFARQDACCCATRKLSNELHVKRVSEENNTEKKKKEKCLIINLELDHIDCTLPNDQCRSKYLQHGRAGVLPQLLLPRYFLSGRCTTESETQQYRHRLACPHHSLPYRDLQGHFH